MQFNSIRIGDYINWRPGFLAFVENSYKSFDIDLMGLEEETLAYLDQLIYEPNCIMEVEDVKTITNPDSGEDIRTIYMQCCEGCGNHAITAISENAYDELGCFAEEVPLESSDIEGLFSIMAAKGTKTEEAISYSDTILSMSDEVTSILEFIRDMSQ